MPGGRNKGQRLICLPFDYATLWPVGMSVWVPHGASGWLKGNVTGYTPSFIKASTTRGPRRAQPHKLRARVNAIPPAESAY